MVPTEEKLLKLLSNHDVVFFIPPYQRNYEWTEEQCKVFFDDVVKTAKKNERHENTEHFFGSITYFQDDTPFGQPDILILIDGQQRITTTMLFLVAFRDITDNKSIKQLIDNNYLKNENVEEDDNDKSGYKIKLKQVETDWMAYKKIILGDDLNGTEKNSFVYHNYCYFKNKLNAMAKTEANMGSLIDKGLNKFSVVTIELEPEKNPWENPQEIFESMNSLGKPLSLADLVRNYLLLGLDAKTQKQYYSKYWLHIEQTIPGQVSNYIRDFMQLHSKTAYHKATEANYKELYGLFKNVFSGIDAKTIMQDLSSNVELYSFILPEGRTGIAEIDYELRDIQSLRVSTAYSFMLALFCEWKDGNFTDHELAQILNAFKIYCFRRRILGITSAENKVFPMLAGRVDELKISKDKWVATFKLLSQQESNVRLPNDVELTRYMESFNFYNFQYCRLLLAMVEEKITKSRPDLNDKHLQIEHIMPQKLNDVWRNELGPNCEEIHSELVNTIGNLTLIRHNQELGQKSFVEKKKVYSNNAGLQIAKTNIIDKDRWTEKEIKNRTSKMIDYILKNVLPIPDDMRRINNFVQKEKKGLSFQYLQLIGLDIDFIADPSITVKVISDHEVEFEGKKWRLSPLTREIQTRRGMVSPSGSYSGAQYWEYDGIKLSDIL